MTTQDVRPVCMFCQTRFTLAPGTTPTRCESWRSPDGAHVERRVATPEQRARMRLEREAEITVTLCAGQEVPTEILTKVVEAVKAGKIPAPTPFDAAALREGKPVTGQTSLF